MVFVIPPKSQVGIIDPEISGEGQKVIYSDGEVMTFNTPPPKPVMPDWSGIKSLARYFNRTGFQIWPAWLYHPTEEARLVKNAQEAAELGVCYREASIDEKGRYGRSHVWDWTDESKWRPQPHGTPKFDPSKISHGKNYMPSAPNPAVAQNAMIEALIPAVAAAVAQSLKATSVGTAPAAVDPKEWDQFLQFKAWQEASAAVHVVADEAEHQAIEGEPDVAGDASSNALNPDQDRALWAAEAERLGIKVDGRWRTDRIKTEIEKKKAA